MGGPGLTLFAPRACVAGLTHTQATDHVATPTAWAAGAAPAAVGSPAPVITGCNTARVSLHRPSQAGGLLLAPAPPPQALGPRPPTSLAAEAGPPRGTAAASGCWMAVPVIGTGAPQLAARPKPACRARCGMGQGHPMGWLGRRPGADHTQVGGPRTHRPGSGCPRNRGGTGRLRSQAHRWHHAHTQGRSPGSRAPSGPQDNLDTPPARQSVSPGALLALSDTALTPHHGSGERKQRVMGTPNPSPQQSAASRRGASAPGRAVGRQPREPPDPRVVRHGLSAVKDRPGVCRLQDPQTRSRAGTTQSCIARGGEGIAGHHCHSPAPQSSPVLPGGHRHCPVTRSQGAPPQKQEPEQFTPNVPPGHSAGRNKTGGAALLPQHNCWAQPGSPGDHGGHRRRQSTEHARREGPARADRAKGKGGAGRTLWVPCSTPSPLSQEAQDKSGPSVSDPQRAWDGARWGSAYTTLPQLRPSPSRMGAATGARHVKRVWRPLSPGSPSSSAQQRVSKTPGKSRDQGERAS